MKMFKCASLVLAMFLLFGVSVEASSPKVLVTSTGEVQVSNVGNNVVGIEVTLQLSSGSFSSQAFTQASDSSYTFEKISGSKITIYSTGQQDLSDNGTIILGNVHTTSGAVFASGATVNMIDSSLVPSIYSNVAVVNESTGNTGNTTTGNSNTSSNSTGNSSSESAEAEDEEAEDEEVEDEEVEAESLLDGSDMDSHVNDADTTSNEAKEQNKSNLYLWLVLLAIVLTGGCALLYTNKKQK